jgi:hypothetical protein
MFTSPATAVLLELSDHVAHNPANTSVAHHSGVRDTGGKPTDQHRSARPQAGLVPETPSSPNFRPFRSVARSYFRAGNFQLESD